MSIIVSTKICYKYTRYKEKKNTFQASYRQATNTALFFSVINDCDVTVNLSH